MISEQSAGAQNRYVGQLVKAANPQLLLPESAVARIRTHDLLSHAKETKHSIIESPIQL